MSQDNIGQYLIEIHRSGLLTKDEEKIMLRHVKIGMQAQTIIANTNHGLLTKEQIAQLSHEIRQGKEASTVLVKKNLRFVVHMAKKFRHRGLDFNDLIAEGNLGLINAIKKFNMDKYDVRLQTYAAYWIVQSIRSAIKNTSKLIRLPCHIWDDIHKWHVLALANGIDPETSNQNDIGRLANKLEFTTKKANLIVKTIHMTRTSQENNGTNDLMEMWCDHHQPTVRDDRIDDMAKAITKLNAREKLILEKYFGLNGTKKSNLREIGEELEISHERIRQIKAKALDHLKKAIERMTPPI